MKTGETLGSISRSKYTQQADMQLMGYVYYGEVGLISLGEFMDRFPPELFLEIARLVIVQPLYDIGISPVVDECDSVGI